MLLASDGTVQSIVHVPQVQEARCSHVRRASIVDVSRVDMCVWAYRMA